MAHPNSKVDKGLLEKIAEEISPVPKRQATEALNGALFNLRADYENSAQLRNRDIKKLILDKEFFTGRMNRIGAQSVYVLNNYAHESGLVKEPVWKGSIPEEVFLKYIDGYDHHSLQGKFEGIEDEEVTVANYWGKKKKVDVWKVVYIR